MNVINFGSINVDFVYQVDHFVQPGETIQVKSASTCPGGKGLNQSIALARAGANVLHAGFVGPDSDHLTKFLQENGVDISCVEKVDTPTGHAIIQVNAEGENSILVFAGANHCYTPLFIEKTLKHSQTGDIILVTSEINEVPEILEQAKKLNLTTVFNATSASHFNDYPLHLVDFFILNEIEGQLITEEIQPEFMLKVLSTRYPNSAFVLTLGDQGARYLDKTQRITVPAEIVPVVDATAAGDTFIGYFLANMLKEIPMESCLKAAIRASALCIGKQGASVSVPFKMELAI